MEQSSKNRGSFLGINKESGLLSSCEVKIVFLLNVDF